jgi:hypothetical protein
MQKERASGAGMVKKFAPVNALISFIFCSSEVNGALLLGGLDFLGVQLP